MKGKVGAQGTGLWAGASRGHCGRWEGQAGRALPETGREGLGQLLPHTRSQALLRLEERAGPRGVQGSSPAASGLSHLPDALLRV